MKFSMFAIAIAMLVLSGTTAAEARRYKASHATSHEYSNTHRTHRSHRVRSEAFRGDGLQTAFWSSGEERSARPLGARPGKWCGWWMRTQKGGGPQYNVAWNWRRWGSPTSPQVGAVVVWPHHVGVITGQAANGRWVVKSGNDGNRVRERARSVSGAVFRI